MSSYVLLERAEIDFLEISLYIEERNRTAALKWERAILEALDDLARFPAIGHLRLDLGPTPLRVWPVGQYVLLYDSESDPILIVAILHGARDLGAELFGRRGDQVPQF